MSDCAVLWKLLPGRVEYLAVVREMDQLAMDIASGHAGEEVWILEHAPVYTVGRRSDPAEIMGSPAFPVHETGRGGRTTYHGPGQRVAYVMLDLDRRGRDLHLHVRNLEQWVMRALNELQVEGLRRPGRSGVWIGSGAECANDRKIAAVGVRVRRWITSHGVSINVSPDLSHYDAIAPCGIREHGVTSLEDLGAVASMDRLDMALWRNFPIIFGSEVTTGR